MTWRAGVLAGLIACLILVAGLWALNNTRAGLGIKCNMLNDVGACLLLALSEPSLPLAPRPTVDPVVAAELRRQDAERQQREAEARAQRDADQAVEGASVELELAVQDLASVAENAAVEADGLNEPLGEVEAALEEIRREYEELQALIAAGSTGDFWVDDVSFQLYDVQFARDSVDFAADGVEFSTYAIEDAERTRHGLTSDVEAALSDLRAVQTRHPTAAPPPYSASAAASDLHGLIAELDRSIAAYEGAQESLDDMLAEADHLLDEATAMAASVGAS